MILSFNNVGYTYHTKDGETNAIAHMSFGIERGEFVAIIGPSGCGKTTILSLTAGLLQPSYGEIVRENAEFGYMLQRDALFPWRTVEANIFLPLEVKKRNTPEMRENALRLAEKYGLKDFLKKKPTELSGGMRQRVMIAIALLCNPKLIIADEPTTALDVTIQAQILDLLREIKHKINGSIMLITHDLGVVAEMADYVVVMYAGRVIEMGTAEDIFDNPLHPYTIGLQKSKPTVDGEVDKLYCIPGFVPNPINMPNYCYFRDRCEMCKEKCAGEYPDYVQVSPTHKVACYLYGEKKEVGDGE